MNKKEKILSIYSKLLKQEDYPNISKIVALFDFWLDLYFIASNYKKPLPKDCLDLYVALSKENYTYKHITQFQNQKTSLFKRCIKFLLYFIPIPYAVLIGGKRIKLDDFIYLITIQKLNQKGVKNNKILKVKFLNEIEPLFGQIDFVKFKLVLSDCFFINPYKIFLFPNQVYGAPLSFLRENSVGLLFVKNISLKFSGIQHGGCTMEYKSNRFDILDAAISNEMLHWGFGDKNIEQNMFKKNKINFNKINKIYLVESLKPFFILNKFFKGSEVIFREAEIKREEVFINQNIGLLKHPRSKEETYKNFSYSNQIDQLLLKTKKSSLFILDTPCQTFLYKAVFENLPFIMFLNIEWNKWYTEKYLRFMDFLKSVDILFYWHEQENFLDIINKNLNNFKRLNNNDIQEYLSKLY